MDYKTPDSGMERDASFQSGLLDSEDTLKFVVSSRRG